MALLTTRPDQHYPVFARGHGYKDVKDFQKAVNTWLDDHNISYVWDGENTSLISGMTTYTYYFSCVNAQDAVFAALRWA